MKGQARGQFVFKRHLYRHSICVFFVRTLTFVGVGDQAIFLTFLWVAPQVTMLLYSLVNCRYTAKIAEPVQGC